MNRLTKKDPKIETVKLWNSFIKNLKDQALVAVSTSDVDVSFIRSLNNLDKGIFGTYKLLRDLFRGNEKLFDFFEQYLNARKLIRFLKNYDASKNNLINNLIEKL